MKTTNFLIRPLEQRDHGWVADFLKERWGSERMVSRGKVYSPSYLPGFAAVQDSIPVGLVTYRVDRTGCEVCTLDSVTEGRGVGTALMNAVRDAAVSTGCNRLWLITTNDNLHAIRFYQKWGMRIAAVRLNALEESRKLKPEIPLTGVDGIPLRDEIELQLDLQP